jgi:hypothetical protein
VKKGRHRRFEEARAAKRATVGSAISAEPEPCPECGAEPGDEHATWCLHEELEDGDEDDDERDPLG